MNTKQKLLAAAAWLAVLSLAQGSALASDDNAPSGLPATLSAASATTVFSADGKILTAEGGWWTCYANSDFFSAYGEGPTRHIAANKAMYMCRMNTPPYGICRPAGCE